MAADDKMMLKLFSCIIDVLYIWRAFAHSNTHRPDP